MGIGALSLALALAAAPGVEQPYTLGAGGMASTDVAGPAAQLTAGMRLRGPLWLGASAFVAPYSDPFQAGRASPHLDRAGAQVELGGTLGNWRGLSGYAAIAPRVARYELADDTARAWRIFGGQGVFFDLAAEAGLHLDVGSYWGVGLALLAGLEAGPRFLLRADPVVVPLDASPPVAKPYMGPFVGGSAALAATFGR